MIRLEKGLEVVDEIREVCVKWIVVLVLYFRYVGFYLKKKINKNFRNMKKKFNFYWKV